MTAYRTFTVGDFVRVAPGSTWHGMTGRVVSIFGPAAEPYTIGVELPGVYVGRGMPFAPSELDYAEVGDRMLADVRSVIDVTCDHGNPVGDCHVGSCAAALHPPATLTGGTVPAHVPGAYPRLSCCGGPVGLVPVR